MRSINEIAEIVQQAPPEVLTKENRAAFAAYSAGVLGVEALDAQFGGGSPPAAEVVNACATQILFLIYRLSELTSDVQAELDRLVDQIPLPS